MEGDGHDAVRSVERLLHTRHRGECQCRCRGLFGGTLATPELPILYHSHSKSLKKVTNKEQRYKFLTHTYGQDHIFHSIALKKWYFRGKI